MQEARILVMDDEEQERNRIISFLVQRKFDVLGVGSVDDAMEVIRRERSICS